MIQFNKSNENKDQKVDTNDEQQKHVNPFAFAAASTFTGFSSGNGLSTGLKTSQNPFASDFTFGNIQLPAIASYSFNSSEFQQSPTSGSFGSNASASSQQSMPVLDAAIQAAGFGGIQKIGSMPSGSFESMNNMQMHRFVIEDAEMDIETVDYHGAIGIKDETGNDDVAIQLVTEDPSKKTDDDVDLLKVIYTAKTETGVDLNLNNLEISQNVTLSNAEEEVYDRQIRLWGIEAQQRMMNSRVLLVGKNGIQEEAIKNMVLAGISITLANDHVTTESDLAASFFLRRDDLGKPHALALAARMSEMTVNKDRVQGVHDRVLFEAKQPDGSVHLDMDFNVLCKYDVVVTAAEDFSFYKLTLLNEKCRRLKIAFFVTLCNGIQGTFFTDLNEHVVLERLSKAQGTCTIQYNSLAHVFENPTFPKNCSQSVKNVVAFITLQKLHSQNQEMIQEKVDQICQTLGANVQDIQSMYNMYGKSFPITCGVLGGYLALEIRKYVTKQHETIPNFCVFDMNTCSVATAMI